MLESDHTTQSFESTEAIIVSRRLIETALQRLKTDGNLSKFENNPTIHRVHLVSSDKRYFWRITNQEVKQENGKIISAGDLKTGLFIEGIKLLGKTGNIDNDKDVISFSPTRLPDIHLPRSVSHTTLLSIKNIVGYHFDSFKKTEEAIALAEVAVPKPFEDMMAAVLVADINGMKSDQS